MKLIPIKISELKDGAKYHVYDPKSHIYYFSRFNARNKTFVTETASYIELNKIKPEEIKAVGAEFMTHEQACKNESIVNVIVEG